ncbi:protein OSCP1 isoform X2 [Bacillus rossius redtenbacheri]
MSSIYSVPLLFLNLGGEMMYIINQRLHAQKIAKDKASKVLDDIISLMLNEKFLNELFKPQEIYNKAALRKLFEDLAHASIMRLNSTSMEKLYDLMKMVFKYQIFMARQPRDIILITLNHLDAIRSFISNPSLLAQADMAYEILIKVYGDMALGELQTIRYHLLNFLQDVGTRVSVFLRQGSQNQNGSFVIPVGGPVPPGCEVPGFIRHYGSDRSVVEVAHFPAGGDYTAAPAPGSLDKTGCRGTDLGCNIYVSQSGSGSPVCERAALNAPVKPRAERELQAGRAELNLLLSQLLVDRGRAADASDIIHLNLFSSRQEEE